MRLKTIKSAKDVTLHGVTVELETVDNTLKSVTLRDGNGGFLKVTERGYNLYAEIPAPPATEKRYRLSGIVAGVPVNHDFADKWEADKKRREFEGKVRDESDANLTVEEVEVEIAE